MRVSDTAGLALRLFIILRNININPDKEALRESLSIPRPEKLNVIIDEMDIFSIKYMIEIQRLSG